MTISILTASRTRLTILLVIAALAAGLSLLVASPAYAGGPPLGGDGNTGGGLITPPQPAPQPGANPGPTPQPGPPMYSGGSSWESGGPTKNPPTDSKFPAPPRCGIRNGEASDGWTWEMLIRQYSSHVDILQINYACHYRPHDDRTGRCGYRVSAWAQVGNKSTTGWDAIPVKRFDSVYTAFAKGDTTEAACARSFVAEFEVSLDTFGYHQLGTQGSQKVCSFRHYHDNGQVKFLGCGGEIALPQRTFKATTWCKGTDLTKWVTGIRFNLDDCRSDRGGSWSCSPSKVTSWNGWTPDGSTPQEQRSGVFKEARWSPMNVNGLYNLRGLSTRFFVSPDSTPYNKNEPPNGHKQFVMLSKNSITGDMGADISLPGVVDSVWVAYLMVGQEGQPSTTYRQLQFTGSMNVTTVELTGIDFATGEMKSRTTTKVVTAKGSCTSSPLQVDVFRARISN